MIAAKTKSYYTTKNVPILQLSVKINSLLRPKENSKMIDSGLGCDS